MNEEWLILSEDFSIRSKAFGSLVRAVMFLGCVIALPLGATAESASPGNGIPNLSQSSPMAVSLPNSLQESSSAETMNLSQTSGSKISPTAGSTSSQKDGVDFTMPDYTIVGRSELLQEKNLKLDESRDRDLLPKFGTTNYSIDQEALKTMPQGENTPLDKVLLQAPGVSYDSAISNPDFHVRNEYANVQYRINGIQLPDGVSALGPILETGFIGNLSLLDGALPAQYGLRTAGVVDITTKTKFDTGGNIDVYGGSWDTFSPSIEYGGHAGQTEYFLTGRYLQSQQGLENAMSTPDPIHDSTTQEKIFGYGSTLFGDSVRLTYMGGAFVGQFQIPDLVGQEPLGDFGPAQLSSAQIDDNETDQFFFGVLAVQTHKDHIDTQTSISSRYATVDFVPDVDDDLAFNDVASNVTRKSLLSGLQVDAADRLCDSNTLRIGLGYNIENTQVDDSATILPLDSSGNPLPTPVTLNDYNATLGWNAGGYLQDEWRIFSELTLNAGLRYDRMSQFVSADQLSPRFALIYKAGPNTTIHAGISRYFTPPMQAQATPNNLSLFQNTTQEPEIPLEDPVQPERATYTDLGIEEKVLSSISGGLDAYYKDSTDTLDDGQFGQAVVLDQFNYAHGYSEGAECKLSYDARGFRVYGNFSYEVTRVEDVVSNEYVIGDPLELAYMSNNYSSSSDAQTISASFGSSYHWHSLLASIDGIYGSGLPEGFANEENSPGYTQWNAALAWSCDPWNDKKSLILRLSAINLFDQSYVLRAATGVGEFAPQYGPRRGLFTELTQEF